MKFVLPDLCDKYGDSLQVLSPMLKNFGGKSCFHGRISTVKCHEDNSLVADAVKEKGNGSGLVVDGGGSLRCALLGDNLAAIAASNSWEGIIVNGCIISCFNDSIHFAFIIQVIIKLLIKIT